MGDFFISSDELWHLMAVDPGRVRVFDVRRPQALEAASRLVPGSRWRDHTKTQQWSTSIPADHLIVVNCMHGHNVSQIAGASLREAGRNARVLAGGVDGWRDSGLPTVGQSDFAPITSEDPSKWVTRINPKIDRVACPWLIRRFIDPDAQILFAEPEWVIEIAGEVGGTAFDTPGAPIEHDGELCSFDTLMAAFGLDDPALEQLAVIVRGADTGRNDLAPEAAGLLAIALGISAMGKTDHDVVRLGLTVYDALYARLRLAAGEAHGWKPMQASQ